MAAPDDDTLTYRKGLDPTDDVSAYGGASSGVVTDQTAIVLSVPIPTSGSQKYYVARSRKNTAAGSLQMATLINRTGMLPNTLQGPLQAASTSLLDTGPLIITGQVSGAWSPQESKSLNGTSTVTSLSNYDASATIPGIVRVEYLDPITLAPTVPKGNIAISCMGQTLAQIWADVKNGDGDVIIPGTTHATTEIKVAIAHAMNDSIGAADRKTAPTIGTGTGNINAFARATSWPGADAGLAVPGGSMETTDEIYYVTELTVWGNVPPTQDVGKWTPAIAMGGVPTP